MHVAVCHEEARLLRWTMATEKESISGDAGVYGKPERNLVGYGAETPDPKWPNNVSIICSRNLPGTMYVTSRTHDLCEGPGVEQE